MARNRSLVRSVSICGAALIGASVVCAGAGLAFAGAGMYIAHSRRRSSGNFAGKIVVITGGSRGLGLAMAEEFGRRGARLVLIARDEWELERAARQLVRNGSVPSETQVLTIAADLRRQEEAERMIEEATHKFGRVDVLVNNAGVITVGPLENQTPEDFREVMDSNFFTGLYCTLAVLPQMLKRREGAIANITSIGGKIAVPHLLPYTASKFAAVGFSEGLAAEMDAKGIRVTTVVPGLMRTGSHLNALFTGDATREYRWFSFAATMPGASIAARRAARQIVDAIAARAVEVTITPQALIASRFEQVLPGLTHALLRNMNRFLPSAPAGVPEKHRGHEVSELETLPARTIGRRAAARFNQTQRMSG
jgi:short-subunit dehydrogenase